MQLGNGMPTAQMPTHFSSILLPNVNDPPVALTFPYCDGLALVLQLLDQAR